MELQDLKNKNIHILGISGAEGSSLALFLISLGCKNLTGHDFKTASEFKKNFFTYHDNLTNQQKIKFFNQLKRGLNKIKFRNSYLTGIRKAEIIFAPASYFRYKQNQPFKKVIEKRRVTLWNWYNLLLEFYPGKIIGITGTAGKGTVTNLIFQILKAAKLNCFLAGESWHFIDLKKIFKAGKKGIVVAEVNNRTLLSAKFSKKSPSIAVITNIFPHHLDDHRNSFAAYQKVKLEIFKYQKKNDYLLINGDDKVLKKLRWPKKTLTYRLTNPLVKLIKNPSLKPLPFKSDAAAAIKVAKLLGINRAVIKKALNAFKPRSGRLCLVKQLKGVKFIDDGAATRVQSTILALRSFPKKKVILILEGFRKQPEKIKAEYLNLIKCLLKQRVKAVFLSGRIKGFLAPLMKKYYQNFMVTDNLSESVKKAYVQAKTGEVVLLSPAGESFGEFKDYRQRSKKFIEVVNKLK